MDFRISPRETDQEETGRADKGARGLVQLCWEQQAHLHRKGETEGTTTQEFNTSKTANQSKVKLHLLSQWLFFIFVVFYMTESPRKKSSFPDELNSTSNWLINM